MIPKDAYNRIFGKPRKPKTIEAGVIKVDVKNLIKKLKGTNDMNDSNNWKATCSECGGIMDYFNLRYGCRKCGHVMEV